MASTLCSRALADLRKGTPVNIYEMGRTWEGVGDRHGHGCGHGSPIPRYYFNVNHDHWPLTSTAGRRPPGPRLTNPNCPNSRPDYWELGRLPA